MNNASAFLRLDYEKFGLLFHRDQIVKSLFIDSVKPIKSPFPRLRALSLYSGASCLVFDLRLLLREYFGLRTASQHNLGLVVASKGLSDAAQKTLQRMKMKTVSNFTTQHFIVLATSVTSIERIPLSYISLFTKPLIRWTADHGLVGCRTPRGKKGSVDYFLDINTILSSCLNVGEQP